MSCRWIVVPCLGLSLLLASGCPEPGEEGGDEVGETGVGETGADAGEGSGVEEGGDVNPPIDTGNDGDEDDGGGEDDGDDAGDDAGDGDGDGDGGDEGGNPDEHPERCWDSAWSAGELPVVIFDNTIGRNDDRLGSCGVGAAPDFQLDFMAPWDGKFTFDTSGSSFDTVLILDLDDGDCGSPELACNDDFIGLESRLNVELVEGQHVTVSVDGSGPFEEGPLTLTISEFEAPNCAPIKLNPPLPEQVFGDTLGAPSALASACGGANSPEQVYEFTPPVPGTYRFSTAGSSFDTVLYAIDGAEGCGGQPLVCNDDAHFELQSELELELVGGQKTLIVVDGHDENDLGEYTLLVEEL